MASVEPDVRVFNDPEALSRAAAELLVLAASQAFTDRGRFLLCLSGGTTPRQLFSVLAETSYREQIPWSQVHVFWGDERCVPSEDLNSNYRTARELLLSKVPIPQESIHPIHGELEPDLAADEYALTLKRFAVPPASWPRFDVVLLGLGEDGHTAALFPGAPAELKKGVVAVLAPEGRPVRQRVTLTPEVFNLAHRVVFLVQGTGKSKIVASVLYGEPQPVLLPPQRIKPESGQLIWMLDASAAANS